MLYGVNANRMMLTRTRKRLAVARRGHLLMKHKLEELMHLFQADVENVFVLHHEVNDALHQLYGRFLLGRGMLDPGAYEVTTMTPVLSTSLEISMEHLLNLKVPVITTTVAYPNPPYAFLDTNADMDAATVRLEKTIPLLLKLATLQRRLELLIHEIEVTRRRVNALEFVLIPRIEAQARFIQMKLDEMERSNTSRLMRIKAIIRKEKVS